ncbi:MAG: glutamate mutase L [Chloroflexi bacterium]|nr:glutamate mutase L [Chloroflexota bacterium]
MMDLPNMVDAETLLAVDVGSVHTRASLFDVVDNQYRLVATGRSLSTATTPLLDISEGVRMAMDQIQTITGRRLLDEQDGLIMPSSSQGAGVDVFVATSSAGPRLRAVLVGLTPGVSLESGRRLATSSYLDVVEEIGLADRRREDERIDLILAARPDLILIVGGTDGGADESVLRLVEGVALAAGLRPAGHAPRVLYAGNRQLGAAIVERFADQSSVSLAPNVRPSLENEDLTSARNRMAEVIADLRSSKISGFDLVRQWSGGYVMLTADAFGRVIRHLSQTYEPRRGVLGVDLGASQTTIAAAFGGDLRLTVRTDLGLGAPLPSLLRTASMESITRWLPSDIADDVVRDYIFNKSLQPQTIPMEKDELHLEFALARQLLQTALGLARSGWPKGKNGRGSLLPPMEPILAGGGVLSRAPRPGYAALALLDSLQPTGITTLVLDPYGLTPALGAAAAVIPMVAVQVLESGSYVSLGTVVSPLGGGRTGRPVARVKLEREGQAALEGEVRLGQLVVLPLPQGEVGRLTLRPERGFDVGFGAYGKAGTLKVTGGAVGLIIDARGRPLALPKDAGRRRELNQKWLIDIGALQ